jgi:hypothetical protein
MTPYKDLKGNSGVVAYEIGDRSIIVEFRHHDRYVYDYSRPGHDHVETMKKLAREGRDLSTYISKNVRKQFARKL